MWQQAKRTAEEGRHLATAELFEDASLLSEDVADFRAPARALRKFAGGAATVENALPCLALLPRAACISMQDVSHDLGENLMGPEIAGGPDASRGGVWSAGRFRSFSAEEKATRFQGWLHLACVRSREVQAACKQTRGFTRDDVRTRGA